MVTSYREVAVGWKEWSDSGDILKVQPTGYSIRLSLECERKKVSKKISHVFN